MVFGGIYDKNGRLFAFYGEKQDAPDKLTRDLENGVSRFLSDSLILTSLVVLKSEHIGTIYLRTERGSGPEIVPLQTIRSCWRSC